MFLIKLVVGIVCLPIVIVASIFKLVFMILVSIGSAIAQFLGGLVTLACIVMLIFSLAEIGLCIGGIVLGVVIYCVPYIAGVIIGIVDMFLSWIKGFIFG